uniref:Uncharacterized protein n=1 Tax=Timema tahoe TaxID=61484 RepID=A0A7R9IP61_9NEOP|nr:unnamed protein product [Timema tahoe]
MLALSSLTVTAARKTCNSCKCPREAHDVYHVEWVNVRDRLGFKPPADPDRRSTRERSMSEGFSWVPPGIPSHQINRHSFPPAETWALVTAQKIYRHSFPPSETWALVTAQKINKHSFPPDETWALVTAQKINKYSFPPDETWAMIEEYFHQLTPSKVPHLSSAGEKYRDKQLMYQLPKQDLALAYCKNVDVQHHPSYEDFINARNEIALDIGYAKVNINQNVECPSCCQNVAAGKVAVIAPKFGERTFWHPACFVCTECSELLVDLTYCVHDDLLYCERHYAEQLKPRCAACDEVGAD